MSLIILNLNSNVLIESYTVKWPKFSHFCHLFYSSICSTFRWLAEIQVLYLLVDPVSPHCVSSKQFHINIQGYYFEISQCGVTGSTWSVAHNTCWQAFDQSQNNHQKKTLYRLHISYMPNIVWLWCRGQMGLFVTHVWSIVILGLQALNTTKL